MQNNNNNNSIKKIVESVLIGIMDDVSSVIQESECVTKADVVCSFYQLLVCDWDDIYDTTIPIIIDYLGKDRMCIGSCGGQVNEGTAADLALAHKKPLDIDYVIHLAETGLLTQPVPLESVAEIIRRDHKKHTKTTFRLLNVLNVANNLRKEDFYSRDLAVWFFNMLAEHADISILRTLAVGNSIRPYYMEECTMILLSTLSKSNKLFSLEFDRDDLQLTDRLLRAVYKFRNELDFYNNMNFRNLGWILMHQQGAQKLMPFADIYKRSEDIKRNKKNLIKAIVCSRMYTEDEAKKFIYVGSE